MYEPFYCLSGKPFQLSPDPSFFYESRVHRRAYAYLEYGFYQGEGFIVITGAVGAGKTLLVRNLLAHLNAVSPGCWQSTCARVHASKDSGAVYPLVGMNAKPSPICRPSFMAATSGAWGRARASSMPRWK
jgi:hypothetical protein